MPIKKVLPHFFFWYLLFFFSERRGVRGSAETARPMPSIFGFLKSQEAIKKDYDIETASEAQNITWELTTRAEQALLSSTMTLQATP